MPKSHHRLTAAKLRHLKAPGLHADGLGLYLQIRGPNARSWIFRYRRGGKLRDFGLGSAMPGALSLKDARELATKARRRLADGVDPIDHREAEKAKAVLESGRAVTFKQAADIYVEAKAPGWRNEKHAAQWRTTLEQYAMPVLGKLPVAGINTDDVLRVLEPIWKKRPETASRLRGRIEAILAAETAKGRRHGPNPAAWRGHLETMLAPKSKVKPVKHFAALAYTRVPELMQKLRERADTGALALQWVMLTVCRSNEALGARPEEVDLEKAVWTIPGERTKTHRPHRVALSPAALAIYKTARKFNKGPYLFAGRKADKPLSNMAMTMTLRRLGYGDSTVHGTTRSGFRDWCAERTNYPRELAEKALAHVVGNETEEAYQRSDLLERRRPLMQAWAKFSTGPAEKERGKVLPLRKRG
jgi:integrase